MNPSEQKCCEKCKCNGKHTYSGMSCACHNPACECHIESNSIPPQSQELEKLLGEMNVEIERAYGGILSPIQIESTKDWWEQKAHKCYQAGLHETAIRVDKEFVEWLKNNQEGVKIIGEVKQETRKDTLQEVKKVVEGIEKRHHSHTKMCDHDEPSCLQKIRDTDSFNHATYKILTHLTELEKKEL